MVAKIAVIGAGLVGLSSAWNLDHLAFSKHITVFEKEADIALHQSGRNSGVVHSGVYYKPGSIKARTCRRGRALLRQFCSDHAIPLEEPGKLITAILPEQIERLDDLLARGLENQVAIERISAGEARRIEPKVAALAALWVSETGIVDYQAVAGALAEELTARGHRISLGSKVEHVISRERGVSLLTSGQYHEFDLLVNCAGLHSDRVAGWQLDDRSIRIVPFLGRYYRLRNPARFLRGAAVYPVPDPRFPFLGVHFTPRLDGSVLIGPNAVLAPGRESYTGLPVDLRELASLALYPGFLRMAMRHWRMGLAEVWRSMSRQRFAAAASALVPGIRARDLAPAPSGIRAQALDREGRLVDDFVFRQGPAALHVLNAPSPAATACLAIGEVIAERSQMVLETR